MARWKEIKIKKEQETPYGAPLSLGLWIIKLNRKGYKLFHLIETEDHYIIRALKREVKA